MGQAVRGAALSYTLDDNSSGAFAIIGRALVATRPLDYKSQAYHDVVVRATDETGASHSSSIRINVDNTNDAPVMAANAAAVLADLTGRAVLSLHAADQDAADNSSGAFNGSFQFATGINDNAQFSIDGANLRYEGEPLNFEDPTSRHSFVVEVQARDQTGALSAPQRMSVALTDVNEQPTLQVPPTVSFDENTAERTVALLVWPATPMQGTNSRWSSPAAQRQFPVQLAGQLPSIMLARRSISKPAPSISSASRYRSGTPAA